MKGVFFGFNIAWYLRMAGLALDDVAKLWIPAM